jgi:assimilatory nitrate reductase catalytic subunit
MLPVAALTHCPYCALNCGLVLREQAGTVVGFDRWKRSPLTRGALCSKGVTAWEQMPHADRIVRPLVRRRGRLVETSWEAALDQAAAGFARIAARQGDAANAVLSGGSLTNEVAYLVGKFARLALRTPHIDLNGRMCMTSAGAAYTQTFGVDRAPTPLAELDRADAAVVIGANLSSTFPVVIPSLLAKLRRRGGTVIVVDPRAGRFVADGDCWLPLRPGTDAVVANGLLREIARLGAIDESFCSARTTGLGDALAAAEPWSPEAVEAAADVPAARIREAAATLARADRVMYLHARGAEQQVTGVHNVRAWLNVALARGHVGRPGCGIDMLTGQRNGQGGREHGQRCDQLPSGRSIENPDHRRVVAGRWGVDEAALPRKGRTYVELIADARARSVAGMLLLSTNPMVSAPDLDHTATALDTLEHLVVIDPFLSETAARAHVVLPGTTFGEIEGTITSLEGRVLRCDQAVPPAAGRSEIDVLRNLANRLGAGRHFRHTRGRDVFDELRQVSAGGPVDYAGITWTRLRDGDGVFWPCPAEDHPGTPMLHTETFGHADGRARFARVDPSPAPEPTTPSRPLVLTTGRVLSHYLSGAQTRRIPAQVAVSPEPVAEIHPATATACGLAEGQPAQVISGRGDVVVAWAANPRLRRDTVFLPYHWPVANRLTAADQLDPVSRIPNFKVIPVQVGPVGRSLQQSDSQQPVVDSRDHPRDMSGDLHDQRTTTVRGMA